MDKTTFKFPSPKTTVPSEKKAQRMLEVIPAILTWSTFDEATAIIRKNPYPLAFYIFTKDKKTEQKFLRTFSFGGGSKTYLRF